MREGEGDHMEEKRGNDMEEGREGRENMSSSKWVLCLEE